MLFFMNILLSQVTAEFSGSLFSIKHVRMPYNINRVVSYTLSNLVIIHFSETKYNTEKG